MSHDIVDEQCLAQGNKAHRKPVEKNSSSDRVNQVRIKIQKNQLDIMGKPAEQKAAFTRIAEKIINLENSLPSPKKSTNKKY